jgi:16S rRNA (uracil1498-N3)-methyltransferase
VSGFRPRFFVDQDGLQPTPDGYLSPGAEVALSPGDSHHALRVLRLKHGDACEVVVGAAVYAASVSGTKEPLKALLTERLKGVAAGAAYRSQVGLVQALTRPALLDEVLEKGTEVGTSFFILVPADDSIRMPEGSRASRLERWRRIVVQAAKQSKHLGVPTVEWANSLQEALEMVSARSALSLFLEPGSKVTLRESLERMLTAKSTPGTPPATAMAAPSGLARVALWIGPESGWSKRELERFAAADVEAVRLGQGVLRAETAGPVAVAATRLVIGDW